MTVSKPPSTVGKGQLRCFSCRTAYPIKDGSWRHREHGEVFLCRPCDAKLAEQKPKRDG